MKLIHDTYSCRKDKELAKTIICWLIRSHFPCPRSCEVIAAFERETPSALYRTAS